MNKKRILGVVAGSILAVGVLAGCGGQPSVTGKCVNKYIEYDGAEAEYQVVLRDNGGMDHHIATDEDDHRSANCHPETGSTLRAKDLDEPDVT